MQLSHPIPQIRYDDKQTINLGPFFELPYNNGINLNRVFPPCSIEISTKIEKFIHTHEEYEEIKKKLDTDENNPVKDTEILAHIIWNEYNKGINDGKAGVSDDQKNADSDGQHPDDQKNADSNGQIPDDQQNINSDSHIPDDQQNADSDGQISDDQQNVDSDGQMPDDQLANEQLTNKHLANNLWSFFSEYTLRIANNYIDVAFRSSCNTKDKLINAMNRYIMVFSEDEINILKDSKTLYLVTCKYYEPNHTNILLSINKFPISFAYDYLACYLSLYYSYLYMMTKYYKENNDFKLASLLQYFYAKFIESYNGLIREARIDEKTTPPHISNYYLNHHQLGPQSQLIQEIVNFLQINNL